MNQLSAILSGKCPHCRKAKIFKNAVLSFRFAEMNMNCPDCGTTFIPEPGFYIGAMYISYAFNVAILVAVGVGLYTLTTAPDWVYILIIISISFLLIPVSFRYSRIIFLHAFGGIKYNP
jgi:uncharacterized protein (DUF983 family)